MRAKLFDVLFLHLSNMEFAFLLISGALLVFICTVGNNLIPNSLSLGEWLICVTLAFMLFSQSYFRWRNMMEFLPLPDYIQNKEKAHV